MKFKIKWLYEEEIEALGLTAKKEVYKIITRSDSYNDFNKYTSFYKNQGHLTAEHYFESIRKNCSRRDNKKFYDVEKDRIIQYEYNYYVEINSLEDLEKLESVIGGFNISIKNKVISVHDD